LLRFKLIFALIVSKIIYLRKLAEINSNLRRRSFVLLLVRPVNKK
jgi:hypothetical protein